MHVWTLVAYICAGLLTGCGMDNISLVDGIPSELQFVLDNPQAFTISDHPIRSIHPGAGC